MRWWKQATDMRLTGIAVAAIGVAVIAVSLGIWIADVDRDVPVVTADDTSGDTTAEAIPEMLLIRLDPDVLAAIEAEPTAGGDEAAPETAATSDSLSEIAAVPAPRDRQIVDRQTIVELPAWRRFSVAAPSADEAGPMIALVIDDMGVARNWSRQATELPGPLTLAFLPYADDLAAQTAAARRAGHELLVHIAMEPDDPSQDTGPNALLVDLAEDEMWWRLEWNLARFGHYVGVNNHMGSRFSRDASAMSAVLAEIEKRGLLYLDSRTTADSLGWRLARNAGLPTAKRDVFIDNVPEVEKIARQLDRVEALALKNGYAVAIGHPRPVTLRALAEWLPDVVARGFTLVPISAIAAYRSSIDLAATTSPDKDNVKQ